MSPMMTFYGLLSSMVVILSMTLPMRRYGKKIVIILSMAMWVNWLLSLAGSHIENRTILYCCSLLVDGVILVTAFKLMFFRSSFGALVMVLATSFSIMISLLAQTTSELVDVANGYQISLYINVTYILMLTCIVMIASEHIWFRLLRKRFPPVNHFREDRLRRERVKASA